MTNAAVENSRDIKTILAQKRLDGNYPEWQNQLQAITQSDVKKALAKHPGTYRLSKLLALVSPAAENYLEQMAQLAHQLTVQRFGRTIRLYAPLYLSNFCANSCKYCGFNEKNNSKRTRLSIEQALQEADIIASNGFTDILLVSGDDREFITIEYLTKLAGNLRKKFSSVSIEIYQLTRDQYARLFKAGIEGVTIYQETYNRRDYAYYHPAGSKSDYETRLKAPDDIASAGMRQIGLGVLLGLTNWRLETLALAEHAHYLIKRYWKSRISFSFPRLRPACQIDHSQFKHLISDKNLVQIILALRLCFADTGFVLSTRESAELRNHLIKLGITKASAGSKTSPGGYSGQTNTTMQFEVDDDRSPAQVADMIKSKGFEPIWKDWDAVFTR